MSAAEQKTVVELSVESPETRCETTLQRQQGDTSDRDAMQARAETAIVNPAKTSVRDIMTRIAQHDGYGLRESEIKKLAQHVLRLETLIARREIGWYDEEHKYLVETGVL